MVKAPALLGDVRRVVPALVLVLVLVLVPLSLRLPLLLPRSGRRRACAPPAGIPGQASTKVLLALVAVAVERCRRRKTWVAAPVPRIRKPKDSHPW